MKFSFHGTFNKEPFVPHRIIDSEWVIHIWMQCVTSCWNKSQNRFYIQTLKATHYIKKDELQLTRRQPKKKCLFNPIENIWRKIYSFHIRAKTIMNESISQLTEDTSAKHFLLPAWSSKGFSQFYIIVNDYCWLNKTRH